MKLYIHNKKYFFLNTDFKMIHEYIYSERKKFLMGIQFADEW